MDLGAVPGWMTAGVVYFNLNISKNDSGFGKSGRS